MSEPAGAAWPEREQSRGASPDPGAPAVPDVGVSGRAFERVVRVLLLAALALTPLAISAATPAADDVKWLLVQLIAAAAVGVLVARIALRGRISWPSRRADNPLALFLAVHLVSAAVSRYPHAGLTEAWRAAVYAGAFLMGASCARGERGLRYAAWTIAATAGLVAGFGILQRAGLADLPWAGAAAGGRSFSTLANPNFLAAYLVMALPVTVSLSVCSDGLAAPLVLGLDIALQAACLACTFSRGGWIGGAVALAALALVLGWRGRFSGAFTAAAWREWAVAGILVAALALGLSGGRRYSPLDSPAAVSGIRTRVLVYEGALRMFASSPVLGWGAGTFGIVFPRFRPQEYPQINPRIEVRHAHCEYLHLADELGLVGLGVFVWFVWTAARAGLDGISASGEQTRRCILAGLLAGCAGILAHGMFSSAVRTPAPALHLWMGLGILAAARGDGGVRVVSIGRRAGAAIAAISVPALVAASYGMGIRPYASRVVMRSAFELKEQERWEEAAARYGRATRIDAWNAGARYERAACLVELGRHDEAMREYEAIERLAPDYLHTHYNMALLHAFAHRWRAATEEFGRARATAALPRRFSCDRARAIIESARSDRAKELALFEMAAESRFDDEGRLRALRPAALQKAMSARGAAYFASGRLDEAEIVLRMALREDPDDRAALGNLAGVYFKRGQYDDAIATCERVLARDPEDLDVATNVAKAWLLKGDAGEAERIVRSVLGRAPSHADAARLMETIRRRGARGAGR